MVKQEGKAMASCSRGLLWNSTDGGVLVGGGERGAMGWAAMESDEGLEVVK
jgi:hypothetical protein